MLNFDPDSAAYREGAEAGRDIANAAVDCPYMPPDPRRDDWMTAFGAVRREVSRASDPDYMAGQREPGRPSGGGLPDLHEG